MIKLCKNEDCLHIYPSFRPFFISFNVVLSFGRKILKISKACTVQKLKTKDFNDFSFNRKCF